MTVDEALQILIPKLVEIYGDTINSVVLYGSFARKQQTPDSDVDIAVFVKKLPTKEIEDRAIAEVVDLELETDRVLSVIDIDIAKYEAWVDTLPFYKNIREEGVQLWKAA